MEILAINNVHAYIENDIAYLKLEDVARGLGFVEVAKSGNETVRWRRVKDYLDSFNFIATCGDGNLNNQYIPENIFYKLCMKANNEVARKFQDLVCDEVLPSIRKHGAYMTESTLSQALLNPDFIIQLANNLKSEQEAKRQLQGELDIRNNLIAEFQPIKEYVDNILSSNECLAVTQIAADYGISAVKLNKILESEYIQRKVNDQWILYQNHKNKGYTKSHTVPIGNGRVKVYTMWTQKGRLKIHEILTNLGYHAEVRG